MCYVVQLSNLIEFNQYSTVERHDLNIVEISLDHCFDQIVSLLIVLLLIVESLGLDKSEVKAPYTPSQIPI